MNPNYYHPQSSGAAQMTGYQPARPAAPQASPGPTEEAFRDQVRGNSEETLAALVEQTGWRPEWIQRLVHLRATEDPRQPGARRHMPFEMILEFMQRDFPDLSLRLNDLRVGWDNIIRKAMKDNFRVRHRLPAATAAARPDATQHPQMSFQDVHVSPYGAHQPGPGASYGGSQSEYGGQQAAPQPGFHSAPYGGPQPGHHQQYEVPQPGPSAPVGRSHVGHGGPYYGASQPGFGNPYPNTPGTTQQLPPVASTNPRPPNQLPPIAPIAQVPTNRGPAPVEPPYQMSEQNYNSAAPQAMTPATQQPQQMIWYRTGRSGRHSQARHGGDVSEQEAFDQAYQFTPQERDWLLNEGIYLVPGHDANRQFYEAFRETFGDHRLPSKRRVLEEFGSMRS